MMWWRRRVSTHLQSLTFKATMAKHEIFMRRSIGQVAHTSWMATTCVFPMKALQWISTQWMDLQKKEFPKISVLICCDRSLKGMAWMHIYITRSLCWHQMHKRKWREWALVYGLWQKDKWQAVQYSDEFKFNLFGSDGQEWCCKRPGEEFRDCNTQKTVKHGGGSVMV